MKNLYVEPIAAIEKLDLNEICTDIVSASMPNKVDGGSWSDFIRNRE